MLFQNIVSMCAMCEYNTEFDFKCTSKKIICHLYLFQKHFKANQQPLLLIDFSKAIGLKLSVAMYLPRWQSNELSALWTVATVKSTTPATRMSIGAVALRITRMQESIMTKVTTRHRTADTWMTTPVIKGILHLPDTYAQIINYSLFFNHQLIFLLLLSIV